MLAPAYRKERVTDLAAREAREDRHRLYEDALAVLLGTLFVALGMLAFSKAGLLVGGVIGIALIAQYATGLKFWLVFFLLNLPFYFLAVRSVGWLYSLRTLLAVTLVTLFSRSMTEWIDIARVDPAYAAVMGGALCGTGLLILFRHGAGLGGINILAVYVQERHGVRAGYFQLAVDLAVLSAASVVVTTDRLLLSVAGATLLNLVLAINHKPGRYLGHT